MKRLSKLLGKLGKLHLGLYFMFGLMVLFGSTTAHFFEVYSLIDLNAAKAELRQYSDYRAKGGSFEVSQADWLRIFRPVNAVKLDFRYVNGKMEKKVVKAEARNNLDLYLLFLLFWLWPLYRYYFSKKPQDTGRIERRIIGLPKVIFALGWVLALERYFESVFYYSAQYGHADAKIRLVFAVSSLLLGTFVSYLNLELTGLYIRRHIARPFFAANNPHGVKNGSAISLTLRYALMMFSLAMVPLLLLIYVPAFSNFDIFTDIVARAKTGGDLAPAYEQLRVLIPLGIMAALAAILLVFQAVSILLYRQNVQVPLSALVRRMKAVAAGDFDCKTSVLYADEMGQLKGHFNMMLDGLVERDRIKDTFGRYVSMEIAEKIMKSGRVNLAGEEIQATVLFSDIRGFTPLSEKLPPVELIGFLNEYFSYITRPITENRGVINKFIGDAVMAIFSPVFGVEDHQEAALRAALGMREALKKFNAQGSYPEVCFGVGVHSGGLVAGNVGTEARLEYTVLGDTVNVASRIESQTKTAATQILLSEAAVRGVNRNKFPGVGFIECPPVLMKGKSKPMVLYKVEPLA